jgi:imidazolonepropionase-like amidohydrolase
MPTLYRGGKVFDGTGRLLDGHGVLVEGARIARVAPLGEFAGWAGETVDTAGGTLMPGLIDTHMHTLLNAGPDQLGPVVSQSGAALALHGLRHVQATLAGGITSVRDVGGKDFVEVAVRDAIRRGDYVGPTMLCSGHIICMTGGHAEKIGRCADGADEILKAVREQLRAGVDLIKLMATGGVSSAGSDPGAAQLTEAEIAVACAEAKRHGRRAAAHAHGAQGILNAVRGGITSIEHGMFLDRACVDEMVPRGVWLVPTFSVGHWTRQNAHRGTIPAYIVEKSQWAAEKHRAGFRMFYEAGGKIALGTDAGTQYNAHGMNAYELVLMVDAGMRPADALVAGTGAAAELMGLADRGRIAEGLAADLLLVDGDPVADIRRAGERANHRMVVKDGRDVAALLPAQRRD